MSILIDFRKFQEILITEIQKSLVDFSVQYPKIEICTVGLAGDGFHGRATLFLDTSEHSALHVEEYLKYGSAWYGEDEHGRFCNSCADFPYCIGKYKFQDYPDFYQASDETTIHYITLSGKKEYIKIEEGDEGMNRMVFPFLKETIASFQPFTILQKEIPFRCGVQMYDSLCSEFWNIEVGKKNS
jgi:hypothetical protein